MTQQSRQMSRRKALRALGTAAGVLVMAPASALTPTARQSLGPFYPTEAPLTRDSDLTRVSGQADPARGVIADLRGRVLDGGGRALAGARIEIWQCDLNGVYRHPRERNLQRSDPGFQGFGHAVTGQDGGYRFRTIRPAPYPGRTPHIHFAVFDSERRLLVTQLYVEGEPRNDTDFLYNRLTPEQRQTVTVPFTGSETNGGFRVNASFDIVISTGAGATAALG